MSDSPTKTLVAAVSALAAMVGVVVAIDIWRERDRSAEDSANGDGDPTERSDADLEDSIGIWQEIESHEFRIPRTFQGDDCRDQHFDLDDQDAGEPLDGDSATAELTDLIWYSCGDWQTGHLRSLSESGIAASGVVVPDKCRTSLGGGDSPLAMTIDPDHEPTVSGCLITGSGAIATVSVFNAQWVGDAAEAEVFVSLWRRVG
jgi:hypothetical protein